MPNHLLINYDETNLTNGPGRNIVIVTKGCRHPAIIMDSVVVKYVSVMFAGAGSGERLLLPIVYQAKHMVQKWSQKNFTIYQKAADLQWT